jgi:hypothetical protein
MLAELEQQNNNRNTQVFRSQESEFRGHVNDEASQPLSLSLSTTIKDGHQFRPPLSPQRNSSEFRSRQPPACICKQRRPPPSRRLNEIGRIQGPPLRLRSS